MNKRNKIKKGIEKICDFNKACECEKTKSYKMTVLNKNIKVCEDCNGVKSKSNTVIKFVAPANVKRKNEEVLIKENAKEIMSDLTIVSPIKENRLTRIEKFLKIAKYEGFEMMITRQNIIDLERKYHIKRPVWLMKDKTFRLGLGAYSLIRATKELEAA